MEVNFPTEYFRPEIRSGFYVDGMMKRVWAASAKVMLQTFAEVCEKYNIQWFADYGTLLGAVRHGGFIPWDDDIDVCMLRDDYTRFKRIMYNAFPQTYSFLTYDNPDRRGDNQDLLTRVLNVDTKWSVDQKFLQEYYDCPFSTGLDIFPLDFIPDDPDDRLEYKHLCALLTIGISLREKYDDENDDMAQTMKAGIEQGTGYHFNDKESIETQCIRLSEAVFSMYHRDECHEVASICEWTRGDYDVFPIEWFENPHMIDFEGMKVPVMSDPHAFLKKIYGDDYMSENRNFPSHDYPFYKEMEKKFISAMGTRDPFYYHFTGETMKALRRINQDTDGTPDERNILFIVPKVSDWKYMEFYYDALVTDENNNIIVMPIPYYDCDLLRNPTHENYEYSQFSDELPLADYRTVSIEPGQYDEIVISFPYDQYDYTEMIDERYFSKNLRNKAKQLTYISPYETYDDQALRERDQAAMRHYVTVPGVIYADNVYVQSEKMKEAYKHRLISFWKEESEADEELKKITGDEELNIIFEEKIKIRG